MRALPAFLASLTLAPLPAASQGHLYTLASPTAEEYGYFGISVAGVPDVDGDGRSDLLVGAASEDGGALDAGRAHVYSGATGALLYSLSSPSRRDSSYFGVAVSGVSDVDGDGHGDLLVGAFLEGLGGRVHVFSGTTGALLHTLLSPNEEELGWFGESVSGVADVDGDGLGDLLVGAQYEDPGRGPVDAGRAYVFSGQTGALLHTLTSPNPEPGGFFGNAVAGVPDTDGDGRGDLLIGARNEIGGQQTGETGRAYLFSGATGTLRHDLTSPDWEPRKFGDTVSGVPDADGDGRGDLLVGAPWEAPPRVYLFSGASGTLRQTLTSLTSGYNAFGTSIAGVPDVTGDGRGDLLIGASLARLHNSPASAAYMTDAGRAFVYDGATGALVQILHSPNAEVAGQFGQGVAGVGDVSGDGRGDLLIGAPYENPGTSPYQAGRAYVFSRFPLGESALVSDAHSARAVISPNPACDYAALWFSLEEPSEVRLALYDVLGRKGAAVEAGRLGAGPHRLGLDLSGFPAGVYVWRLTTGARVEGGRLTVAR
jgi:hypothetical protein